MDRQDCVYLDHAASTPPFAEVAAYTAALIEQFPGNPSGVHRRARKAAAIVDEARERIAKATASDPKNVIFTSGGTEADNLAIKGPAFALRKEGLDRIVVSSVEHHAVLDSALWLRSSGFKVDLAPVGRDGLVDLEALETLLDEKTCVVSCMTANNETGALQPIREIAEMVREKAPHAVLHTDACQGFASIDISLERLGVDALTLSSHKIGGPQGAGALVLREGIPIEKIAHGGGQELGRRAGTQNVAAIAGFGLAAELAALRRKEFCEKTKSLRDDFERRVISSFPWVRINGAGAPRLPHISNMAFAGLQAEDILVLLDRRGVCASAGAACSSGSLEPSHVLVAMGLSPKEARSSVRFSFGHTSTPADVNSAVSALKSALSSLRPSRSDDRVLSRT